MPPVRITLPDGAVVSSEQDNLNQILSQVLNRQVTLGASEPGHPAKAEEYWPDMEGLDYRDTVTDFNLPEGTFFDCAVVHLLTTATVNRLRELYPEGRFEVRRFRPCQRWPLCLRGAGRHGPPRGCRSPGVAPNTSAPAR
jgi:hypothetical protein